MDHDFTKEAQSLAKKLLPYLVSGGAGALGGGLLASQAPVRDGESKSERRKRILKNSLGLGVGVAGAHAALSAGLPKVVQPIESSVASGVERLAHGLKTNLGYYAGAGTAGAAGIRGIVRREERGRFNAAREKADAGDRNHALRENKPAPTPRGPLSKKDFPDHRPSVNDSFVEQQMKHDTTPGKTPGTFAKSKLEQAEWRDQGLNADSVRNRTHPAPKPVQLGLKDLARNPVKTLRSNNYFRKNSPWGERALMEGRNADKLLFERTTGLGWGPKRPTGRSGKGRAAILAAIFGVPQLTSYLAEKSNPEAFRQNPDQ